MIESPWIYLAALLLCAGLFPFLETRLPWRIFKVLPAVVLTYLLMTALSALGVWQHNQVLADTRQTLLDAALPALMVLLLANCDIRAILRLGPRILAGFLCACLSMYAAIVAAFLLMRALLPADAWQTLGAVSGGWIGGTANLVAVSQAIDASPNALANALLIDSLCYSFWVLVLFASVPLQAVANARLRARPLADDIAAPVSDAQAAMVRPDMGVLLLWLGGALLLGQAARTLAGAMPATPMLGNASWTMLWATALGLLISLTPLRRLPGSMPMASALLAVIVAAIASQADFRHLGSAPLFLLTGVLVLLLHGMILLVCARLFRFDLALCGISSLACVGGVASTPLLAAAYAPVLAPVGVLLAMLGYVLGTGGGILLSALLQSIGSGT